MKKTRGLRLLVTGEWKRVRGSGILFLDDDLTVPQDLLNTYANAAHDFPEETGFIGLVQLPQPPGNFSRAILASGAMDIFSIALRKSSFVWGATANFMLRRSALQGLRFSEVYPKSGGGEDVDLFLRIRENNHFRNYKTLPEARVNHPWWNDGRVGLQKTFSLWPGKQLARSTKSSLCVPGFFEFAGNTAYLFYINGDFFDDQAGVCQTSSFLLPVF